MKHGGQLNIAQVAALTPMSVEDAQRAMKRLQSQGVAEIEFTTEGEVFYQFAGLDNLSKLTSGGEASGPVKSERRARPISKREV